MPKVMCNLCLKLVERTGSGRKYTDENGKWWHGLVCPSCRSKDAQLRFKKLKQPRVYKTARKCRVCFKNLPQDRYFKHRACDYAHFAYASNGQTPTVWTESDWGCGTVDGVRI